MALTPAEQKIFLTALLCSEGGLTNIKVGTTFLQRYRCTLLTPLTIDFEKFTRIAGYKNDTTARVCYNKVRRKVEMTATEQLIASPAKGQDSSEMSSQPSTPRKPRSPRVTKTPKSAASKNGKAVDSNADVDRTSPLKRELFKRETERSVSPSPKKAKKSPQEEMD
ncbi:hypothetical protein KEM55_007816, partial [Ascosphaera atra]